MHSPGSSWLYASSLLPFLQCMDYLADQHFPSPVNLTWPYLMIWWPRGTMWAGPEGACHVLKGRSFSIVFKQREEALVLDEAKKWATSASPEDSELSNNLGVWVHWPIYFHPKSQFAAPSQLGPHLGIADFLGYRIQLFLGHSYSYSCILDLIFSLFYLSLQKMRTFLYIVKYV